MALFLFTNSILKGEKIQLFNKGNMVRDFTYVDDIVESLMLLLDKVPYADRDFNYENPNPSTSDSPYRVFNIGNSSPRNLTEYIEALEEALNIKAQKEYLPMQLGDVPKTAADTAYLEDWIDFKPNTDIREGIQHFIEWYRDFYKI